MSTPAPANAQFIAPSSRTAHKRKIFDAVQQVLAASLSYTVAWGSQSQGVHDRDFIDWVEDVLKSLPRDEGAIPESMIGMFDKIMKRTSKCELRIVELVNASGEIPAPVLLERADGTSSLVEQVKAGPRHLSPHTTFEFGGNTSRFFPVADPFIVTFTPAASKSLSAPPVPAMSYEVSTDGDITERDKPLRFTDPSFLNPIMPKPCAAPAPTSSTSSAVQTEAEDIHTHNTTAKECFSFGVPPATITSSSRSGSEKEATVVETAQSDVTPSAPQTAKKSRKQTKSKKSKTTKDSSKPEASTEFIPFPTMGPPPTIPTKTSSTAYCGNNPDSVFAPGSPPAAPFNHFPVHPQANSGEAPLGVSVGLQRAHAFNAKSHPELFWHNRFGEMPKPGEKRTVEECLSMEKSKSKSAKKSDRRSARESQSRPSSNAAASFSTQTAGASSSTQQGNKRAREEAEADEPEEEKTRYSRRLRSNSAKSDSKLADKLSGMKNAVMNFANGAFNK